MKTTTKRNFSPKPLLITLGIILLLIAGASYYVLGMGGNLFGWTTKQTQSADTIDKSINTDPPTTEQTDAGNQTKSGTINNDSNTGSNDTPGDKNTVAVTIPAANQDGSTLRITSLIQAVTNSGTCTLTLTNGSTSITKTSDVQANSSSSTCKGFSIPTSELSSGKWNVALSFENDSLKGSASKTVDIN